jgi:hypothetical protein
VRKHTERNDGGLYRSLVDLNWAAIWIEEAVSEGENDRPAQVRAELEGQHADQIAQIDAAERRFWACDPWARERADWNHPICGDWDMVPQWCQEHADLAEERQAELERAVDDAEN